MQRVPPQIAELELEPSAATLLMMNDSPSLFREGFYTPSLSSYGSSQHLPWKSVREVIEMADNALKAKQRAAEKLAKQLDALQKQGTSSKLLKRAQRAEVDSGSLLDELQQLIQAKADVAQQRADLNRANMLLVAERELLCEQLQVSPDNVNLCQAVSKVLATARRAKGLDAQLRLLAKCQRELLLQLEAQREATARAERAAQQWQAEKQVYLQVLEQHGIKAPVLPEPAVPTAVAVAAGDSFASAAVAAAGGEAAGGLGSTTSSNGSLNHSSSAVLTAQLMVMRIQSAGAGACPEQLASSPHAHLPPGTPPVHDMGPLPEATPPMSMIRRSHSLDSGLNSLTGLLDQLALGQLCGSEEGTDAVYDDCCESESWTMADAMSADMEPWFASSAAASASAGSTSVGGRSGSSSGGADSIQAAPMAEKPHQQLQHHHHQQNMLCQEHLQPVLETEERC